MATMLLEQRVKERRADRRVSLENFLVSVQRCSWPLWIATGPSYSARGVDLSFGGIAFKGREHFRPGEHVTVTIFPKGGGRLTAEGLRLHGRVMWSEARRGGNRETVGIRFAGARKTIRTRVAAWTARLKHLLR